MNTSMNPEARKRLRTSDLAAAAVEDDTRREVDSHRPSPGAAQTAPGSAPERVTSESELEALFPTDTAAGYRRRWAEVQSSFVDDPRRAVASGDELVAEVMTNLAGSFAHERERLEAELSRTGEASTETLRVGLRRYRSFFERLLSL